VYNPYLNYKNSSKYKTSVFEEFSLPKKEPEKRKSLTFEILNVFVQKLITPDIYENYELTLKLFDKSLDFFERKISDALYKITKQINLKEEKIDPQIESKVKLQYDYCIVGGELFLDAIDEMRFYMDHINGNTCSPHREKCNLPPQEHLLEGLQIAGEADEKIRISLSVFDTLYWSEYRSR